jgi:hypothetical protein
MTIHRAIPGAHWAHYPILLVTLGALSSCTDTPLARPSMALPGAMRGDGMTNGDAVGTAPKSRSAAGAPSPRGGAAGTNSADPDDKVAPPSIRAVAGASATSPSPDPAGVPPGAAEPRESFEGIEWVATADDGIGYDKAFQAGTTFLTPVNSEDYKPAYSPDFSQITFFRVFDYGEGPFDSWSTKVAVMNADGADVRMLTDVSAHHVPKWTQDGSKRIVFSRNEDGGGKVWWTDPTSSPGDEQLLSNFSAPTTKEENFSALPDGRILVHRRDLAVDPTRNSMMAMTPVPGGKSTYEPVTYAPNGSPADNSDICFSKLTVSPSGTRVAYMKMVGDGDYITQSQIAYADWDVGALTISNEVIIAEPLAGKQTWYPTFTPKEQFIVYAQDGKVYAYEIASKMTKRISASEHFYRYPSSVGISK